MAAGSTAAGGRPRAAEHEVLLQPTLLRQPALEVSVHTLPRALRRELKLILQGGKLDGMLAVLTAQHAAMDLAATGPDVATEKDVLLESVRRAPPRCRGAVLTGHTNTMCTVCRLGQACVRASAQGRLFCRLGGPLLRPSSAYQFPQRPPFPHLHGPSSSMQATTANCTVVYPEVDGFEMLRRYSTGQAGCCKVLHHPQWGAAVYPASLFTNATYEQLQEAVLVTSGEALPDQSPVSSHGDAAGGATAAASSQPDPSTA